MFALFSSVYLNSFFKWLTCRRRSLFWRIDRNVNSERPYKKRWFMLRSLSLSLTVASQLNLICFTCRRRICIFFLSILFGEEDNYSTHHKFSHQATGPRAHSSFNCNPNGDAFAPMSESQNRKSEKLNHFICIVESFRTLYRWDDDLSMSHISFFIERQPPMTNERKWN